MICSFNESHLYRTMMDVMIKKFREFLTNNGYKYEFRQPNLGIVWHHRDFRERPRALFIITNPDNRLKSLLLKYDIEYNNRKIYFYTNEWVESCHSKNLFIFIDTMNDIAKLNVLLAKENGGA